jgi:alpha-amylase
MATWDACRQYVMVRTLLLFLLLTCSLSFPSPAWSQTTKRVVLQGFWWDYWNNNYPFAWANYLADLAPRLRELGIDAVWIPPTIKNEGGPTAVGYAPFDHYDLGDKFQKGNVRTRLGTKDELLRMAAVLHANGMEVVQDIVFNHIIGANVRDPQAQDDQYKIFRYTSFVTPQFAGDSVDYIGRRGRFPKNWVNFHPNPWRGFGGNPGSSLNDVTSAFFGPDICFDPRAYGGNRHCRQEIR